MAPTRAAAPAASKLENVVRDGDGEAVERSLKQQLGQVEAALEPEIRSNFDFQSAIPRSNATRPHSVDFAEALRMLPIPVPRRCPGLARPDQFCAPNLGRDWGPKDIVFPISYSLPESMYVAEPPAKDKDCAMIVPRDKATYKFANEREYRHEYSRSLYCITYKKGGWDVLRHYEIIAAGCMPYLVDVDYTPEYVLYHLPKKLLLEARDLPGVFFNCTAIQVWIDHRVFPRERYDALLRTLIEHARTHLTTTAMARYVLGAMNKPEARRVLYIAKAGRKVQLRAQGNYNSWTLFHGLRTLLGAGAVDSHEITFLYHQPPDVQEAMKRKLYGMGFGYAFQLPRIDVNRSNLEQRILAREFDLIIFADPSSVALDAKRGGRFQYLELAQQVYAKNEIAFLHVPDIPYADPMYQGYRTETLYASGVVFQREIADCEYFAPAASRKSEMMKRCVWYHNRNCLDDVNVRQAMRNLRLKSYPWAARKV